MLRDITQSYFKECSKLFTVTFSILNQYQNNIHKIYQKNQPLKTIKSLNLKLNTKPETSFWKLEGPSSTNKNFKKS